MARIDVFDVKKNKVGEMDLLDSIFNAEIKQHLVHEAVRLQLTNRRAGTVSVKNRSEVAGSGKKPFKQKGTGQARQGCSRAPQYPGGGVAFGPQPKAYNLSMNKKAYKAALKSALSFLYKEQKLTVLNDWKIENISTKNFASILNIFDLKKTLVIIDDDSPCVELSARNIKNVKVMKSESLNVYDLVNYKSIICTEAAMKKVEGALQP